MKMKKKGRQPGEDTLRQQIADKFIECLARGARGKIQNRTEGLGKSEQQYTYMYMCSCIYGICICICI